MLKFFRKYQKIFFVFIAFVIIVTFSFFGTQGILQRVHSVKDKDVVSAIDGSKIKLSDIQKMSIFLATDYQDINYYTKSHLRANLFNNGVLKEFFRSNAAKIFFEKYFDELKPSFEQKFEKVKKYSFFTHLYDSSISTKSFYEKYTPEILSMLDELKEQKELNLKFLNLLSDLYVEQLKFPQESMRRLLIFQERQKNVQNDPRLYQDSIALLGFDNAVDWFGIDFVDLISEFVINTSKIAEKKGYAVSDEEAFSDLMKNLSNSLDDKAKTQINAIYKNMLVYLSMDEKAAIKTYKQILLYKKYFSDVSNNTFIDSLATKEFDKYAKSKANVTVYSLPDSLHIKNFEDLMKFEMYLLATAMKKDPLDVPKENIDLLQIESKYPQLLEKNYTVMVKHLPIEKAALKVKVKDMYFWQLDDNNFNKIRNAFKFVPLAKNRQEKSKILEELDFSRKSEVDAFSRYEIVKQNPKLIEESLKSMQAQKQEFFISLKDPKLPINIKNEKELVSLLEKQDKIENYTQDNKNFYSFEVVNRSDKKALMSFQKAKDTKVIDKILTSFLKEKYSALREEFLDDFIKEDGSFKQFSEVKQKVAEIVFADVLNKLKSLKLTNNTLNNLAKYRMKSYVQNFKQNLGDKNPKDISLENSIKSQFDLISENKKISRSKNPNWIEKTAFSMDEKKFSSLNFEDSGNIEFFYLDEINLSDDSAAKVDIAKNALSFEITYLLTKKLLKTFEESKCMAFPVREKNERF